MLLPDFSCPQFRILAYCFLYRLPTNKHDVDDDDDDDDDDDEISAMSQGYVGKSVN